MEAKIKIKFPNKVVEVLGEPIERSAVELIAMGLHREGKITLRQAADLVDINMKEMREVLEKHDTYINYGVEELDEDIAYATSGESKMRFVKGF